MDMKPKYAIFAVADNGTGFITHTGCFSKYNAKDFSLNNPIPTFDLESLAKMMLKLKNSPYRLYVHNLDHYKNTLKDPKQSAYRFNDWAFNNSEMKKILNVSGIFFIGIGLGALLDRLFK